MQSGYYNGAGGMVTQINRLNVISNNLANLNTNGYKKDDVVIGDFKRLFEESREELPLQNHTKEAAKFLNRSMDNVPHVVEEYTNYSLGGFAPTGNPLDFALTKPDTFFAIQTPSGVRYSRDGSFVVRADGVLTTKDGNPVLPANYQTNGTGVITVPQGAQVHVDYSGGLHYQLAGTPMNQDADETLFVGKFSNIKELKKEGNSLYVAPNAPEAAADSDQLRQGFIEKSNINPVTEMTALIETSRLVGMYQKVMDTHMSDLNTDAITKLAAVRA